MTDRQIPIALMAAAETLRGDYLRSARQHREQDEKALDSVIDAVNAFHSRCGFMSDEFSTL